MTATGQWLDEAVRRMHHPLTGERLEPIGYTSRGPIMPVLGASEAAPEQPTDDDDEDEDSQNPDPDDKSGDKPDGDEPKPEAGKSYSSEEYEALKARMKAADRRATAAENEAKSFKDKDKTELQKASDRVAELETAVEDKDSVIKKLRLHNAFLSANTYTWHDPELVMSQVQLDAVEVNEDGEPTAQSVKKELDRIAKARPYLVKTASTSPSGEPGPQKSRNADKDEKSRRAELNKRGLIGGIRR